MQKFYHILSTMYVDSKAYINVLDNERLSYLLSYIFIALAILSKSILDVFDLRAYALAPTGVMLAIGFMCYLSKIYERMNSKNLGKWLIALVVILVTKFNFAIADQSINIIFKAPSAAFTYTKTFISILTLPFSLSLILMFTFPILMLVSMIDTSLNIGTNTLKNILTFNIRAIDENLKPSLLFGRMLASIAIFSCSIGFLQYTDKYTDKLEDTIKSFAFNFELQSYNYCSLPPNSKSIMISDHLVYFAVKTAHGYDFKISQCIEKS